MTRRPASLPTRPKKLSLFTVALPLFIGNVYAR